MCHLAAHLLQCRSSLCFHPESGKKFKLNIGRSGEGLFSKAMGSSMMDVKADEPYDG